MYKPIDVTEFAHFAKRMSAVSKGQR